MHCIYIALLSKALYNIHPHHSHTDGGVKHAGRQPACQEQSGWGVLLRDTSTLGDQTSSCAFTNQPALPPELLPPQRERAPAWQHGASGANWLSTWPTCVFCLVKVKASQVECGNGPRYRELWKKSDERNTKRDMSVRQTHTDSPELLCLWKKTLCLLILFVWIHYASILWTVSFFNSN